MTACKPGTFVSVPACGPRCPNGTTPVGGTCSVPVDVAGDVNCRNTAANCPAGTPAGTDCTIYDEEARDAAGTLCHDTLGQTICQYRMSMVANEINSCSPPPEGAFVNQVAGAPLSFAVSAPCGSCVGGNYLPVDDRDTLSVLYFGLTHDGVYDCNGNVRRALAAEWRALMQTDCIAGDVTCPGGLVHAWRPADESKVAQDLVTFLAPPGRGLGVGLVNPFCNSAGAILGAVTLPGDTSDFTDLDPIRITAKPEDSVAFGTTTIPFKGTLGLVLPVYQTPAASVTFDELYPPTACSLSCTLVAPIKGSLLPPGFHCPDGSLPALGACFLPYAGPASAPDPRCLSANATKCFGANGRPDGRAYNLVVAVPATTIALAARGGTPYQFALDGASSPHIMNGSFFRLHAQRGAADFNGLPGLGLCQRPDESEQTGCLVNAESCSMGIAGDLALQNQFPVSPSSPGMAASNQGLIVK